MLDKHRIVHRSHCRDHPWWAQAQREDGKWITSSHATYGEALTNVVIVQAEQIVRSALAERESHV